jgi:hypothetical protein
MKLCKFIFFKQSCTLHSEWRIRIPKTDPDPNLATQFTTDPDPRKLFMMQLFIFSSFFILFLCRNGSQPVSVQVFVWQPPKGELGPFLDPPKVALLPDTFGPGPIHRWARHSSELPDSDRASNLRYPSIRATQC